MKILFISPGGNTQDYQRDAAFLGLRHWLGPDIVDVNKLDSLYVGADRSQMYGLGFSLYAELEDIPVDRTDIPRKIRDHFFDIVMYGSIHRNRDYLHEVVSIYPAERIWAIDGEDHPGYLSGLGMSTFKRELHAPQPGCWPIHFAIPSKKIPANPPAKKRILAPCDPINRKSYIYKTEADYYQQYAESCYGATMQKAGWDCMRHYEILSQWCIPYFRVLESLPNLICHNLPRPELMLAKLAMEYFQVQNSRNVDILTHLYESLIEPVMKVTREKLTTEALGLYILDTMGVSRKAVA